MANITANFTQAEFLPSRTGMLWSDLTSRTKDMALALANTLQTIRAECRKIVPNAIININSAIRPPSYNDSIGGSKTSDHLFGIRNPSNGYELSVGAADIVCPQIDTIEFFNLCLQLRYSGVIKTGQLLLEKNNTFWVHIANDPAKFLSSSQLSQRDQFSKYGIGYNLYNGKSGYWKTIGWGEFYGTADTAISAVADYIPGVAGELTSSQIKIIGIAGAVTVMAVTGGIIYLAMRKRQKNRK